ncbi:MAG: hypothetical protein WC523_03725 [Patescibacteria group bacterium]
MGTRVVGKLDDWNDADLGGSDFMNLEEGSNPVRIITSPYQFYIHWASDATGANRKVRCASDGCPLCQQGERAVARWFVGVLNAKTGKPAILEIGPQIFKQMHAFFKNPKWGDPRKYNIDIQRQPKGSQPLYIVTPEPKEALTDDQKGVIKEFLARVDLVKISASSTPDEVREKMGMAPKVKESAVSNDFDAAEETPASDSDDDSDFNFA